MLKVFSVVLLTTTALGIPLDDLIKSNEIPNGVKKTLAKCSSEGGMIGILNCAAIRLLRSLEKAGSVPTFEVSPGITLVSDPAASRFGRDLQQHESSLPSDPETKASKLLDLLLESASRFVSGRTLKVKLPESQSLARAFEEGRGKMKKYMGPLFFGLGAKMLTMVPLMMGGLSLLTAKALIVAKLAFVISMILFVQHFLARYPIVPVSGFGGGVNTLGTSYGYGTNVLGAGGGWGLSQQYGPAAPYARSIEVGEEPISGSNDAQKLAYAAHSS